MSQSKFEELLALAPITKFLDRRAPLLLPPWRWILLGPELCEASFNRSEAHEPKRHHIEGLFAILPLVKTSLSEEEKLSSDLKPPDLHLRAERLLENYLATLIGEVLEYLLKHQKAYKEAATPEEYEEDKSDWQHPGKFFTNVWFIPELLEDAKERMQVETAEDREALGIIIHNLERTLAVRERIARKRDKDRRIEAERLLQGAQEAYGPRRLRHAVIDGADLEEDET